MYIGLESAIYARRSWRIWVGAFALVVASLLGCAALAPSGPGPATLARVPAGAVSGTTAARADRLGVRVLAARPHDNGAYTQGLLLYGGYLYESTGLEGRSSLRKVDPVTGEVLQRIDLEARIFGEGLARVDNRLIQITWQNHVAYVYDVNTFEKIREHAYEGEGWGLCYDDQELFMSNGSSVLTVRDPTTFEPRTSIMVSLDGRPIDRLNELECVGDDVYANVWFSDDILRIDKRTGQVTAVIDARGLLAADEMPPSRDGVLNGIAFDPDSGNFFITGKLWPKLFEVRFESVPGR